MVDEWLDVVTADDQVIGRATRQDVHARGLIHRACHVFVFRPDGQLFVQKRSEHKDNEPGRWDSSCAGHVDSGEDYLQCAVRELFEELGLRVLPDALDYRFTLPPLAETGRELAAVYTTITDDTLTLDPDEVADGVWLSSDQVNHWIADSPEDMTLVFRQIWHKLR